MLCQHQFHTDVISNHFYPGHADSHKQHLNNLGVAGTVSMDKTHFIVLTTAVSESVPFKRLWIVTGGNAELS